LYLFNQRRKRWKYYAIKLNNTGVIPSAYIAIVGFLSSYIDVPLVETETTKKRVASNIPIIGKPKRRNAERLPREISKKRPNNTKKNALKINEISTLKSSKIIL
jgi:hypothetical protein